MYAHCLHINTVYMTSLTCNLFAHTYSVNEQLTVCNYTGVSFKKIKPYKQLKCVDVVKTTAKKHV